MSAFLEKAGSVGQKVFDFADKAGISDSIPDGSGTATAGVPAGVPTGMPADLGAVANQFGQAFTTETPAVTPAATPPGVMNAVMAQAQQNSQANMNSGQQGLICLTTDQLIAVITAAASGKQQGAVRRRPIKTYRKQRKGKTMKKKVKA